MAITKFTSGESPTMAAFNSRYTEVDNDIGAAKTWASGTFSNPNLLINGNFKNPVNQRGESVYTSSETVRIPCFDTWRVMRLSAAVGSGGVVLTRTETASTYGSFECKQERDGFEEGKTYTLSAEIDGTVHSVSGTLSATTVIGYVQGFGNMRFELGSNYVTAYLIVSNSSPHTIGYIKLEKGGSATPFVPRPYGEALAACQRYYYAVPNDAGFTGSAGASTSLAYVTIPTPVQMRVTPTLASGAFKVRGAGVANATATSVSVYGLRGNAITLSLALPEGFLANQVYWAYTAGVLAFDAEL